MYPTTRQLADLARQRQQALLSQAAEARLVRLARGSLSVPSPRSGSIRSRLAAGLRALATLLAAAPILVKVVLRA